MHASQLSSEELQRYRRQIGPGVLSEEAQLRLKRSAALVSRAGGMGGPAALALGPDGQVWGAGPRASQYLVLGAKARAAIAGRPMADLDDVKAVAPSVLRHRLVTNFAAEAENVKPDAIVRRLVEPGV